MARYETADLYAEGVNYRVDIQKLPFSDSAYDIVYASHVILNPYAVDPLHFLDGAPERKKANRFFWP